MAAKRHLLYLDIEHEDALEEIAELKKLKELNTISKIVRFIILDYYKLITKKTNPDDRLNAMSKELAIVLNLVTSLVKKMGAPQVRNEDVLQFYQAEKYVEQTINENKKIKNRKGNKLKVSSETRSKQSEITFDDIKVQAIEEKKEKDRNTERHERLLEYLKQF